MDRSSSGKIDLPIFMAIHGRKRTELLVKSRRWSEELLELLAAPGRLEVGRRDRGPDRLAYLHAGGGEGHAAFADVVARIEEQEELLLAGKFDPEGGLQLVLRRGVPELEVQGD